MKLVDLDFILKIQKQVALTREAELHASLSIAGHPNIIKYEGSFQRGQNLCFIFEVAQNGNLKEYLMKHKKPDLKFVRKTIL